MTFFSEDPADECERYLRIDIMGKSFIDARYAMKISRKLDSEGMISYLFFLSGQYVVSMRIKNYERF